MRTKKVTRYYCDHCSKGMLVKSAMERHEASCYSNPQRKCHVCFNRDEYKPVAITNRPKEVISISNECPHCLMGLVVRYNKSLDSEDKWSGCGYSYNLDQFRKDCSDWMNENHRYAYADIGSIPQ